MEFKDYYDILGISKTATQKDIQKVYRKLARKYHPDINKDPGTEMKFKEIGEAYDVLKDPEKRSKYDRYGAAWKAAEVGQNVPPGFDGIRFEFGGDRANGDSTFFDILDTMFGNTGSSPGGFGGFRRSHHLWATKGEDIEAKFSLTLEEAARGGKHTVSLVDSGTGGQRSYTVTIPKGVSEGKRIRLTGQGGEGVGGGQAGDLYLVVSIEPHPKFKLRGCDLHTILDISPWQAALGDKVLLDTLDGRVRVAIPPGSSSGAKIRVKGQGFPQGLMAGDLYAEIRIVVPGQLTATERALYEQLGRLDQVCEPV